MGSRNWFGAENKELWDIVDKKFENPQNVSDFGIFWKFVARYLDNGKSFFNSVKDRVQLVVTISGKMDMSQIFK